MNFFKLIQQDKKSRARLGIMRTAHGDVETPVFMPVGTQATVKTLDPRDLRELGAQIILGNAYHLHLRPGEDLIQQMGGLAEFMNWHGPTLTDSGGFQVFSLDNSHIDKGRFSPKANPPMAGKDYKIKRLDSGESLVKITPDGVTFRSHIDGSVHTFTPESAIEIQRKIGADIIMAFDQCTRDDASREETIQAMERTHAWARRCVDYHFNTTTQQHINTKTMKQWNNETMRQYLFGIIQGSRFKSLRLKSAKFITSLPFDGIAIGGESIGYNMEATKKIMSWIEPLLPEDKPRYAMGVGFAPSDLFAVVELGIDMFDCVAPTRLARNGALYISPQAGGSRKNKYRLNITNASFRADPSPIDPWCDCPVCKGYPNTWNLELACLPTRQGAWNFSRAYLHHLFRSDELLGLRLASLHNVRFMLKLMEEIRLAIAEERFEKLKRDWMK